MIALNNKIIKQYLQKSYKNYRNDVTTQPLKEKK